MMARVSQPEQLATNRERGPVHRFPFVPWSRLAKALDWRQGQHLLTVGGTGSGKTTLVGQLLPRRSHVVVCVSKGKDPAFAHPPYSSFERITDWPPKDRQTRVLLWPKNGKDVPETQDIKRRVFSHTFDTILLHEGGWCIDIDELHYISKTLRLERWVVDLEEQGRSADITIVGNTQRPAEIPIACYTNASHAFFFLTQEEYDVKRLGSMRNVHTNAREVAANIGVLGPHEFIYIDRSGRVPPVRSKLDLRK